MTSREPWLSLPSAPGVLHLTYADDGQRFMHQAFPTVSTWRTVPPGPAGRLFVQSADPRIWLSAELVDELRGRAQNRRHPDVTFTGPAAADDVTGWVLTINAVNRRAVYVVRRYVFEVDVWEAEWPD